MQTPAQRLHRAVRQAVKPAEAGSRGITFQPPCEWFRRPRPKHGHRQKGYEEHKLHEQEQ